MGRYLITGGAGFIGSHLAEKLLDNGHEVAIIDDLSTGALDNIEHLKGNPRFHFCIDSVTNEMVLDRLVSESDTVYHLAAAVGVRLIVEEPIRTLETNILGTESVLKSALRYRKRILLASTSEVYGKGSGSAFNEDDDVVLGPTTRARWAYAATKMVDEFLGFAYYRQLGLPVVIVRLFNTVGPRQTGRYGMVIPRFVQQALHGKPLTVYDDGLQSRCFLHVYDAVQALHDLGHSDEAVGNVVNIGSTHSITIKDLAVRVLSLVKPEQDTKKMISYIRYNLAYPNGEFEDMRTRQPDISKIKELIGWEPQRDLDQILKDVIEDYRGKESELDEPPQ